MAADRARPLDLSVAEFLGRLKQDRHRTLDALDERLWRFTSPPIDIAEFWRLFDRVVRDDGTLDLSSFEPSEPPEGEGPKPSEPFGAEIFEVAVAVLGLCLGDGGEQSAITVRPGPDRSVVVQVGGLKEADSLG